MAETVAPEQENLLDTTVIEVDEGKRKVVVDHERIFVPAGGITPKALRNALREQHPQEKYPGFVVVFEVVKSRAVQVLITPENQVQDYKKPE